MDNPETTLHEIITALRQDRSAVIPHQADVNGLKLQQCVLCSLSERSVSRALRDIFAEFVNDPPLRLRLRRSRGFCAAHVPLLSSSGEALGIAILFHDLAGETLRRWAENNAPRSRKEDEISKSAVEVRIGVNNEEKETPFPLTRFMSSVSRFFRFLRTSDPLDQEPCPLCNVSSESDKRYVAALAAGLERNEVWEGLQATGFLCVRHIESVAANSRKEVAKRLIAAESERLKSLQDELEEFIRKNDYRFRHETMGAENDSWRRAMTTLNS